MTNLNLTPETELLSAFMEAHKLSLMALVRCLEDSGALHPRQYGEALRLSIENGAENTSVITLALMHHIRQTVTE